MQTCTDIDMHVHKDKVLNTLHYLSLSFGFLCQQIETQLLICRQISLNYTFSYFYDSADSVITE